MPVPKHLESLANRCGGIDESGPPDLPAVRYTSLTPQPMGFNGTGLMVPRYDYVEITLDEPNATNCVANAIDRSAWFEVTPLPDGLWRIRMKREMGNIEFLRRWES